MFSPNWESVKDWRNNPSNYVVPGHNILRETIALIETYQHSKMEIQICFGDPAQKLLVRTEYAIPKGMVFQLSTM